MDSQRVDHWRSVSWDPGIVDSRVLSVCYDCLCLMALFRVVMFLVHYWAEWSVWTGSDDGHSGQLPCTRGTSLGGLLRGNDFAHAEWLLCLCVRFGGLF